MAARAHGPTLGQGRGVIATAVLAASLAMARAAAPTYEVYAIRYGTLPAFRMSGLILGADTSRRLDIAMMVWLLRGSDGRNVLVDGLNKMGWQVPRPRGTMFVWAPIPEAFRAMGSLEFSKLLIQEAKVAVSPGIGFGEYGEGYLRFALVENEQRIRQALRGLKLLGR